MIRNAPTAIALSLLVALSACGKAEAPPEPDTAADVSSNATETEKTVVFKADGKTGEVGIDLPGGTGASLRLPPDVVETMSRDSKMDIDGVGLYPGSRVTEVAATSRDKGNAKSSAATIRFTAPSTPQAVAEWYIAAFRDKGRPVSHSGSRIEGTTSEGSRFTLDLAAEGQGTAGTMVVTDTK